MIHDGRYTYVILSNYRKAEEKSLTSNAFVGHIAKFAKYSLCAISLFGMGMGYFLIVPVQELPAGIIFGAIGIVSLLMLPTFFSYRCYVDKSIIKETYYILCFKVNKEVLWKNVKYKHIKRDSNGNAYSIHLYKSNGKKLISFDCGVVGFDKIKKMAKTVPPLKR